jgi:hypothetical protein
MKSQKIFSMVLRSSVVIAALLGLYFFKMAEPTVVVNDKEALILQGLMQTIEYVHFAPKKVDDVFSRILIKSNSMNLKLTIRSMRAFLIFLMPRCPCWKQESKSLKHILMR